MLEDIFKKTMDNLWNRIEELRIKYPMLIKQLGFETRDPHVNRMVSAFALISASLQYEVEIKVSKEIRSLLLNLCSEEFITYPAIGIIKVNTNNNVKVKENTYIRSKNSLFKVKYSTFLSNISVKSIEKQIIEDKPHISLTLEGNFKNISDIELFTNINVINTIFETKNEIQAKIYNRSIYTTTCFCVYEKFLNLRDYIFMPEQYAFFSIKNINTNGIDNILTINIPLSSNLEISSMFFETNCIVIENKFKAQSDPILVKDRGIYPLITDNNYEIINVEKITKVETNEIIPHISQNSSGWHVLHNNDGLSIYIANNEALGLISAELHCINKEMHYDNLFFEEYLPGDITWIKMPSIPKRYQYRDEIIKLIQYLNSKFTDYENQLSAFEKRIALFDDFIDLKFKILDIFPIVKPLKISNSIISQVGDLIVISTNTKDFLLLKAIVKELNRNGKNFIECIFQFSSGKEIYLENTF